MESFARRSAARRGVAPMGLVCAFATFSTRRLNEIVALTWADVDLEGGRTMIRDMKHPGDKIDNDVMIVERTRRDEEIAKIVLPAAG